MITPVRNVFKSYNKIKNARTINDSQILYKARKTALIFKRKVYRRRKAHKPKDMEYFYKSK